MRTAEAAVAEPGPGLKGGGEPGDSELIYDLRSGEGGSDRFYAEAAEFTGRLLEETELRAGPLLDEYEAYLNKNVREVARSRGEHALELLTLGMALRLYATAAANTPAVVVAAARFLLRVRRRSARLKPNADWMRGALFAWGFARPVEAQTHATLTRAGLARLLRWLEATGEFAQETVRLKCWNEYLGTVPASAWSGCLRTAEDLFDWFELEAGNALGGYTRGVRRFLGTEYAARGVREDRLFCGRKPVEYQLGMVAAEIMNRGLREGFERTARKVVLVPTCMRGERAATCRAKTEGTDIRCTGCDRECAVNRLIRRLRTVGTPVYLVPHSSSFSKSLERWQREPDVGVVAVACLLNILPGGYEMRARGIASQCVLLDYPGCERHWRRERIPTGVNEERLARIATTVVSGQ